ncbi:MAG: DUF6030 family protein [Allorhizobium sp.]
MGKSNSRPLPANAVRREGGWRFFVLFFLAIIVSIGAIVLLANDFRNLRTILRHYDVEWPFALVQTIAVPQTIKGKRLKSVPIRIPSAFLHGALDAEPPAFVRALDITGPALCGAMQQAGIANDGWKPGQLEKAGYECFSERLLPTDDAEDKTASFFFMAKGSEEGALGSIRIKLVAPETAEGETVQALFRTALTLLGEQTDWGALRPAFDHALALEDFATSQFGLSFRFSREFNSQHRYNLVIASTDKKPADARTRDYFAGANWLPVPEAFRQFRATNRLSVRPSSVSDVMARGPVQFPTL